MSCGRGRDLEPPRGGAVFTVEATLGKRNCSLGVRLGQALLSTGDGAGKLCSEPGLPVCKQAIQMGHLGAGV